MSAQTAVHDTNTATRVGIAAVAVVSFCFVFVLFCFVLFVFWCWAVMWRVFAEQTASTANRNHVPTVFRPTPVCRKEGLVCWWDAGNELKIGWLCCVKRTNKETNKPNKQTNKGEENAFVRALACVFKSTKNTVLAVPENL